MDSKEEAAEMVDRMEGLKAGDTSKSVEELMQKWTTSNMAKVMLKLVRIEPENWPLLSWL